MPNKFAKLVAWSRRALAAIVLVAFVALFTAPWAFAKHLSPLAKAQFWPSVAGGFGIAAIIVVAVTILAGRWYCGVLCPLGAWQDAAFALRRRRAQKASGKGQWVVRGAFLAAFAALGLAGLGFAWLEPYGIFGRIFTTTVGAVAGVAIFLLAVLRGRAWCNWACPVGTILGLLSRFSPFALKIDVAKCVGCRQCEKNCRAAAITIAGKGGEIDPTKCVQCRDCAALCP
ncbi:MAG: 4Fe-4S binding protein, partial [Planctomycetes bacterium]|nr:4Fe-4S binding protein [Planctomycetota bacterium]